MLARVQGGWGLVYSGLCLMQGGCGLVQGPGVRGLEGGWGLAQIRGRLVQRPARVLLLGGLGLVQKPAMIGRQ